MSSSLATGPSPAAAGAACALPKPPPSASARVPKNVTLNALKLSDARWLPSRSTTLGQILTTQFRQFLPCTNPEPSRLFLTFALLVGPRTAYGNTETCYRHTGGCVAHFRIATQIAYNCHLLIHVLSPFGGSGNRYRVSSPTTGSSL